MKTNDKRLEMTEILEGLALCIKKNTNYELIFQGECNINSKIHVSLKTPENNFKIGFLYIHRNKFSWCPRKNDKRIHFKQPFRIDTIDILYKQIKLVFPFNGIINKHEPMLSENANTSILGIRLILSDTTINRIKEHVFSKPNLECGGYLIGQICWSSDEQNVEGYVEDIYHDDTVGSSSHFTFSAQYGLDAYSYCKKNYSNEEGILNKKIIGNYHSHGNFNAFFSAQDKTMIFSGTAPGFFLVYSPGEKEVTALLKNKQQELYAVDLIQNNKDFRYCKPTIPGIHIFYSKREDS